jgi:hypothetical protein
LKSAPGTLAPKKDFRTAKPNILVNEDKFDEHFVFDQQWVLDLDNSRIIMAKPNDVGLYISLMEKNPKKAKSFLSDAIKRRNKNPFFNMMLNNDSTSLWYDYFEQVIAAITYSYTAIETLANICIDESYEYTKKDRVITMIYDKGAIEFNFKVRDKFKIIIREILSTPDPSTEDWYQQFILLEDMRNKIIHSKQSSSQERYSQFLSPKIFPIIEVSKSIIKWYGQFINNNLRHLLED